MMKNNWLKRATFDFVDFDPSAIYQSPDFPHVFLGSGVEKNDLVKVEQMAGKPICMRVNLSSEALNDKDSFGMPNLFVPLPDVPGSLPDDRKEQWKSIFNVTADQVAKIISNNSCPIYVHCYAGKNRSASVLAAAISKLTGRAFNEVLDEMHSIRSTVAPRMEYIDWGNDYADLHGQTQVPSHLVEKYKQISGDPYLFQ